MPFDLRARAVMLSLASLLVVACSSDAPTGPVLTDGGDVGNADLTGGSDDGGGTPQPTNPSGPTVTVTSPKEGDKVVTPRLQVVADVTPGTGPAVVTVDVRVRGQAQPVTLTLLAGTMNTFAGFINLGATNSGPVAITVEGINAKNVKNTKVVTVTYDAGPVISVAQPAGTAYRGSAPIVVEAKTLPTIAGSAMQTFTATIQGIDIPLSLDKISANDWVGTAMIDFHSKSFAAALAGVQAVHLQATDANGASTQTDRTFTVKETGPIIVVKQPVFGTIVGRVIDMSIDVTDPIGVDDGSVFAVWLGDEVHYKVAMTRVGMTNTFAGRFDTNRLPDPQLLTYPLITYTARDRLGNPTFAAGEVILDNTPPVMALDPPKTQVMVATPDNALGFKCSKEFNPVGEDPDMAKDKKILQQVFTVRARITDLPNNQAEGLKSALSAGIDPTTVDLLVAPLNLNGNTPLVADIDGKGKCNALNPNFTPVGAIVASNQALVIHLSPLGGGGTPFYSDDLKIPGPVVCAKGKDMAMPPAPLCAGFTSSEPKFSYAIPGEIWSLGPVTAANCGGLQFDSLNVFPNAPMSGPLCIAVRAIDKSGNRGVSRPIRVCVENPFAAGGGACKGFNDMAKAGMLPSCLGTYDPVARTVNSKIDCTFTFDPPYPLASEPYLQ